MIVQCATLMANSTRPDSFAGERLENRLSEATIGFPKLFNTKESSIDVISRPPVTLLSSSSGRLVQFDMQGVSPVKQPKKRNRYGAICCNQKPCACATPSICVASE